MRESIARPVLWLGVLAVAALTSCNSGSTLPSSGASSVMPQLSSAQAVAPAKLSSIVTYPGAVIGQPDMFDPVKGDAPKGGHGKPVNGIGCFPTMVLNKYHVHIYFGIIYNKTQMALPTTIGMKDPGQPVDGFTNTADCFYRIHTHDSSGIVHFEFDKNRPYSAVFVRLKDFLDIWGVKHSEDQFGPFHGPVHVFVGEVPKLGETVVDHYRRYKGSLDDLLVRSHEVVWVEVGHYYEASQLPSVTFYLEY
jgi:hypothetical protein